LNNITVVSPFEVTGQTAPSTVGAKNVTVTNIASGLPSNTLIGGYTYNADTPPVLAAIGAQGVVEGANLNFVVSASDAESTPSVTTSALPGTAAFTPSPGGGTFDWTPGFLESGVYQVTFTATDGGGLLDSEVVSITVTEAGNQAPVLASIGAQGTTENVNLNFNVSSSDVESTPVASTGPLPSGATFTPDGSGGGAFDWTPDFLQAGLYQVTFYSTDDSAAVDSEIVSITVSEGGNQAPLLAGIGAKSVAETANLNFAVSATDIESTPTVTTSTLPVGASFTPSAGGGTFDWTPGFTDAGVYNVTFYATDDSAAVDSEVVSITVTEIGNQAPVLAAIGPKLVAESANLNFAVSATDAESVPTVTTSALPTGATFTPSAGGGTFDWTPGFTDAGAYDVTFYATDDSAAIDSEVVTITVTDAGNQAPVLAAIGAQSTNENVNLNFAVSSTDAESTPTASAVNLPAGATFTPDGSGGGTFDWTPGFTDAGVYNVTFITTDASLAADSEVVAITVNEVGNQAPALAAIGPQNTTEGAALNVPVSSTDAESIPVITTSPLPIGALFTPDGSGGGSFDWTPDFLQAGVYQVTFYTTDDSAAVDSEIVSITVNEAGNQLPVLAAIGAQSVAENANLNFAVSASDAESIPTVTTSALPVGATFTPNLSGGVFDWTPGFTDAGVYNVTFYATDDSAAVDSEIVTITVNDGGNQPPVLAAIGPQSVTELINLNFAVSSTDAESVPTVTTSALPAGATYTPDAF
ncbi:MAG TPA: putative Ig domain-containing protein, partial [candidate division Zixibacteria bacterium]|nr:putative Ig domain-containing protein [candidate division Zixibacteria bacterium]